MYKINGRLFVGVELCVCLLLCACGGGGNQTSGIDGSGAPIASDTPTVSTGAINGFGSVIVNGVRYNSDKAKIMVNDEITNEDNLHTGYQVKITGKITSDGAAIADTIEFRPDLVGAIGQINLNSQQFTVLEQTVQVTSATLFDAAIQPNYLEGLKAGDLVLVSGNTDDQGVLTATRIELKNSLNHQVQGAIHNLNPASTSFTLGHLTVNYSAATLSNIEGNTLTNGLLVNATGSLDAQGVFQAKTLVAINKKFTKDIKSAGVEGFITRFASATDYDVAGTKCTTDSTTSYENGSANNLALGAAVEVKGSINSSGVLLATKVEFAQASNNEIAGEVTALSTPSSTSIITGNLEINGTSIKTNSQTAYEDEGNSQVKRFNFSSIQVGNFLKVSGYLSGGVLIATKIEREELNSETETELKFNGLVASIDAHSFVLLGRTVLTNNQTEFKNAKGENINETQFYLQAIGQQVKVKGILKNGVYLAKEVEIVTKGD